MNRRQQTVVEYLHTKVRVLYEQLGKCLRVTDHHERLEIKIIRPEFAEVQAEGSVHPRKRLGGLLNYYYPKSRMKLASFECVDATRMNVVDQW